MPPSLQARVLGAGPTGCLAALALAHAGWSVNLVDPQRPDILRSRNRAYAFTHSSRQLLERLGLWDAVEPLLTPFQDLRLRDEAAGQAMTFTPADLASDSSGSLPVGWIGRHGPLIDLLLSRLEALPVVRLALGVDPARLSGAEPDLVVAADGPSSPTRHALGIGTWGWSYRQSCLTAEVDLRGGPHNRAWELLRPEGPFGVLPLGSGRFQLVRSAPTPRARQLEGLDPSAFLDDLARVLPSPLEPDRLLDQPRAFPVALSLARRLSRGRTLLLGESAHRCHPVAGQGLNLCWRDVAVLHRLALRAASGSLAPERLPAAYGRRRWADLLLVLLVTDLLVRIHSNRHPALVPLRRLSLKLLQGVAPLRRLVLHVMTVGLSTLPPPRAVASLAPW